MWDIFFISYTESNCESNWLRLLEFHPKARRLHGITGIHRAHIAANSLCETPFFWVIDGDNYLFQPLEYAESITVDLLMFHTVDPLSTDTTALGAPKLWRRDSFINHDMSKGDFTLFSVKTKKVIPHTFSINQYNVTAWEAWKTSFRHCVKLLSPILGTSDPRYATNINKYLENWRSTKHSMGQNSEWAYCGYLDAEEWVNHCDGNMDELNLINDYRWLENYWREKYNR